MSAETKRAFAKEWFARGECPGCGARLEEVAGVADRHYRPGQTVTSNNVKRTTGLGEVVPIGSSVRRDDPRVCRYRSDDLTSLVLIATDFGRRTEERVTLPARSSVGCPGSRPFGSDRPGRLHLLSEGSA